MEEGVNTPDIDLSLIRAMSDIHSDQSRILRIQLEEMSVVSGTPIRIIFPSNEYAQKHDLDLDLVRHRLDYLEDKIKGHFLIPRLHALTSSIWRVVIYIIVRKSVAISVRAQFKLLFQCLQLLGVVFSLLSLYCSPEDSFTFGSSLI